jgi:uncharacterized membrane protein HdeD (DUF308 family)
MTTNSGDPADNGNGIKTESKYALLVQFALSVGATAVIGYLTTLNLSTLPGWLTAAATMAVSTVIGFLTAYKTKNAPAGYRS